MYRYIRLTLCCFALLLPVGMAAAQDPGFINNFPNLVENAPLAERVDAAKRQGQSQESRFWTAYAFDVRPGIAVDMQWINTNGSTNSYGVMMGGGIETRNLGQFILWSPDAQRIVRVEVFNMDRRRNYSGYPVYWLGDSDPQESVRFLSSVAEMDLNGSMMERTVRSIALHDEPDAVATLQIIVRNSPAIRARTAAISWLGHIEGDLAFFAGIVRDADENTEVRKRAVSAISSQKSRGSLSLLQTLYPEITHRDVKKRILSSISGSGYEEDAATFLLGVARDTEADYELRKQAVNRVGHSGNRSLQRALIDLYDDEDNQDFKQRLIGLFAESEYPEGRDKLFDIAQNSEVPRLRVKAVHSLSRHRDDQTIGRIIGLYDAERSSDVKDDIINIMGESYHPDATRKLIDIARTTTSEKLRKRATYWLGKSSDPMAVQFFENMFK